jgi:8-oxo-dGTP pyrophosphatase MutT (NUDIX family)
MTARAAAVLMLLFRRSFDWHIPLTARPGTITQHGGQISLPGGLIEFGETSEQAALRELAEELGRQSDIHVLGQLPKCYVFASNSDVTPWVAVTHAEPNWQPNLAEVERVIEMPLAVLLDASHTDQTTIQYGALSFQAPCYRVGDDRVWGATSVMLSELAGVIADLAN